ncbi:uncharacterized protein PAC_07250 [Phialocephala subalpina]|uniref:Uncharacterized protein n=1 Tax=Phialocephala subalpina TaxID=576137 RepID=A0A1L7WX54_9HELO|nr:uncharacterized protein PAC_07250 [Phialocephala subalpina]
MKKTECWNARMDGSRVKYAKSIEQSMHLMLDLALAYFARYPPITPLVSPLAGKEYFPLIQTDYSSELELSKTLMARRAIEQTNLECTYIYLGILIVYFGLPNLDTHMRALYIILYLAHNTASILGDGEAKIAISYKKRQLATLPPLSNFPLGTRSLIITSSYITANQIVALAEKISGKNNEPIASHFHGGMEQLKALLIDLPVSMASGAYTLTELEGREEPMMSVELLEML